MASADTHEPAGLADSDRPGRNTAANAGAIAVILALVAGVLLWQKPWVDDEPRAVESIPADARLVLERQFDALTAAYNEADFVKAAGTSAAARDFAHDAWQARRLLGISRVAMEYQRGGEVADRADGSTSARVTVSWAGSSRSPWGASQPVEVPVRFRAVPDGDGFNLVSATSTDGEQLPPWLAGEVEVDRRGQASVVTIDGGSDAVNAGPMVSAAVRKVTSLWPGARRRLCVIVPRTPGTAAALLGNARRDVQQIAAVTTPIAGDAEASAVVLNPVQWPTMDTHAQQVVTTHEAVHALTGTSGRDVDVLVAEGFADYIALYGDKRSLAVSAGQILRDVKQNGPPKRLPAAKDFDASTNGLGAVYESSWMLFRMLGEQFGKDAIIEFYRLALEGARFAVGAQQVFGLGVDEITERWQAYLTKSASTVS
jgi:hypothetical protein